jgi:hypothetical protein
MEEADRMRGILPAEYEKVFMKRLLPFININIPEKCVDNLWKM